MGAIGLNPIRLDRIGLDPIRINAIKLGVPGAASGTNRPYIDPEVLASLKAVCICYGKSNDDPDRAVVKNLVDPDNPFVISNAAYTEGSGYADKDSPYYGAFVTDGIDDLITSTKTVQEMLGGSNEITVVSLITHISGTGKYNIIGDGGIQVSDYSGQTFMAGTSSSGEKIVELGDKEKLQAVQYTTFDSKLTIGLEDSSYAYYGTFVFNKENVPVDWIHQVIAYFNLDRTLNPDILCDVKKQGITNENHAEFGDKLIDFSGNGRDIQLNNIAWKGDSGIGKYETDFLDSNIWNHKTNSIVTSDKIVCDKASTHIMLLYYSVQDGNKYDVPSFSVLKQGDYTEYYYIDEQGVRRTFKLLDGINILPASHNTLFTGTEATCGFGNPGIGNSVTITQIPSHAGALCLDGINDFGKVTGMPIYKDYTFIIDYERISYTSEGWGGAIVSKYPSANNGAFISMMANSAGTNKQLFSFGGVTAFIKDDLSRILFWQTKYKSENTELTVGEGVDGDTLWLGAVRDNDFRFFNGAIYSLMSFPYSMSEFLIERQLKKHKLGTLYPDMVEFRPIVKQDDRLKSITYYINQVGANIGQYYPIGSGLGIAVETVQPYMVKSLKVNGVNTIPNADYKGFNATLDSKFPQKITMDIQVDSSLVQWNPVVESNVEYSALGYLNYSHNLATIKVGDYISIGDTVAIRVVLGNTVDEVVNCKVNGQECEIVNVSPRVFDCKFTLTSESPQKINITIYQPPEYLTMLSNSTLISNETLIKNE